MLLQSWLRRFLLSPKARSSRRPASCRLAVETLEERAVPASFSISDASIIEGNSGIRNALVTVSLSSPSSQPVMVDYSTAHGSAMADSDYQAVSGTLNFPKGVTSKTILVPIYGDTSVEPDETFYVNLRNPKKATIADGQGVVTIVNDDTRISVNDVWHSEGNSGTTSFRFTVSLANAIGQPVTVSYATADGTATAGSDYVAASGTLTIPAGQTSGTITVLVNGDRVSEPDETFSLNLSNPTSGAIIDGQGVGTIADDDPQIYINGVSAVEGNAGTTAFNFTVWLTTTSDVSVTVDFATTDVTATTADNDYMPTSGTLTIPAGQTSGTITVLVNGDRVSEPDETFSLNLSNPTNGAIIVGQGVGTIVDDEAHIYIADASVSEGNAGTTTLTFTLSLTTNSDVPVTVDFATADETATTADNDYVPTSGTLTFAPGVTSQTITVLVNGDLTVEPDEIFVVNLSNPANARFDSIQALGTILSDDNAVLQISSYADSEPDPYPYAGGSTTFYFTVWLSTPFAETVTVDYATVNGTAIAGYDYLPISGTLTFAPGQTSQTIEVQVLADFEYESTESFSVVLSNLSSNALIQPGSGVGTGTIFDNPGYWW